MPKESYMNINKEIARIENKEFVKRARERREENERKRQEEIDRESSRTPESYQAEFMAEEAVLKAAGYVGSDELAAAAQGVRDQQQPPTAPKRDTLLEKVERIRRELQQRKEGR